MQPEARAHAPDECALSKALAERAGVEISDTLHAKFRGRSQALDAATGSAASVARRGPRCRRLRSSNRCLLAGGSFELCPQCLQRVSHLGSHVAMLGEQSSVEPFHRTNWPLRNAVRVRDMSARSFGHEQIAPGRRISARGIETLGHGPEREPSAGVGFEHLTDPGPSRQAAAIATSEARPYGAGCDAWKPFT